MNVGARFIIKATPIRYPGPPPPPSILPSLGIIHSFINFCSSHK